MHKLRPPKTLFLRTTAPSTKASHHTLSSTRTYQVQGRTSNDEKIYSNNLHHAALTVTMTIASSAADNKEVAKLDQRIDAAHAVLHELMGTPDKGIPEDIAAKATCVAVVPGFKKGAFVVGAQYGQGVVTCRTGHGWSAPAFIQLTGASFGLQIGGQSTDLVLIAPRTTPSSAFCMTRSSSAAMQPWPPVPVGRNSQASTTELANAAFLTYSRSKGVFAGIDLTGDVVNQNQDDTDTYYGKDISYQTILSGGVPVKPSSAHFVATVNQLFHASGAR